MVTAFISMIYSDYSDIGYEIDNDNMNNTFELMVVDLQSHVVNYVTTTMSRQKQQQC